MAGHQVPSHQAISADAYPHPALNRSQGQVRRAVTHCRLSLMCLGL